MYRRSNTESKNETAELVGVITQLREKLTHQQSKLDDMSLQLDEKQLLIEKQQNQLSEVDDEEDEDAPVFVEKKRRSGAQRSAAPPAGGQAKKIVELEDEVKDLQSKLAEASRNIDTISNVSPCPAACVLVVSGPAGSFSHELARQQTLTQTPPCL